MKGVILAGGNGSRLFPLNKVISKQLQPVYDKPMIYYPLVTLMEGGIRDICIISTPQDIPNFQKLLGDGSQWGINLTYQVQNKPEGIAQAFLLTADWIDNKPVTLILGDNLIFSSDVSKTLFDRSNSAHFGAQIFGYEVNDPQRYGIVSFDGFGNINCLEEKPKEPKSNFAVIGLYIYNEGVVEYARSLKPSARGELEITDLNKCYLKDGVLWADILPRGSAWLDSGTSSSLAESSQYVEIIEKRTGVKLGCPEEAALNQAFIDGKQFKNLISTYPNCEYTDYLKKLIK